MSDNDLIRRCDAVDAAWEASSLELFTLGPGKIVARIKAIPAVQPTVSPASRQAEDSLPKQLAAQPDDVAELVEALREANGILEDALQEVGDDYPGSNCQAWCQEQVKQARAALARVKGVV